MCATVVAAEVLRPLLGNLQADMACICLCAGIGLGLFVLKRVGCVVSVLDWFSGRGVLFIGPSFHCGDERVITTKSD